MPDNERFECVISTDHAILTGIMQVDRMGIYMDSSLRNKNVFKCPLTKLVTINDHHRMVPRRLHVSPSVAPRCTRLTDVVAAMVSRHIDNVSYSYLLQTFATSARLTAKRFLEGGVPNTLTGVPDEDVAAAC